MNTVELFRHGGESPELGAYDAVVAGSDQVWRHAYGDVASYMFDFVVDERIKKLSYAASFGVDSLQDYPPDLVMRGRQLLRNFSAVSVREASGVEICRDVLGIDAQRHVDPTMLLTPEDYPTLAPDEDSKTAFILSYLLDTTKEFNAVVSELASISGLPVRELMSGTPSNAREASKHFSKRPSVEQWLTSFSRCSYVVTDSFHGTVFAILNNKPFVTTVNRERGATRFESLLDLFGLSERLCGTKTEMLTRFSEPIDWRAVNDVLAQERERGLAFLRDHLLTDSGT